MGSAVTPRALFSTRFAELYAAAGTPLLRRVALASQVRIRATTANGTTMGASVQRISDWRTGRAVPTKWEVFRPVLLTLIDDAVRAGDPLAPELLDVQGWHRLWTRASTWTTGDTAAETTNPYPGLQQYRPEQAGVFFGRARATAEFADLVQECDDDGGGVLALIGASGAGKSSLLAAGLIPTLTAASDDWAVVTMTPGSAPLDTLTAATQTLPDGGRWLVIVDQLEELFTVCRDDVQREKFLAALGHHQAVVVVAVRADFFGHCLEYPVLMNAVKSRGYLLGPMQPDELTEAITGPAESTGYQLESGLAELVVSELGDPGALPLLSHVMSVVWEHRDQQQAPPSPTTALNGSAALQALADLSPTATLNGGPSGQVLAHPSPTATLNGGATRQVLTLNSYREAGGVLGSVATTAEQAWNSLTESQQREARHLLLGLVTVSQDARDTRHRLSRGELLLRATDPEAATSALERLAHARLVTLDTDAAYLSHEIVLDAWPRLRSWIDDDRVGCLERQYVEADAAEWVAADRDPAQLYRRARLATISPYLAKGTTTRVAREFITAAQTVDRTRRRRSRMVLGAALFSVVVLILGIVVIREHALARQRDDAIFAAVLAQAAAQQDSDPSLSAQLDLVAHTLDPHSSTVTQRLIGTQALPLATPLVGHDGPIHHVAANAHGLIAVAADDGSVQLWDSSDAAHPKPVAAPLRGGPGFASAAVFSPDGTILAMGGADHAVHLWDVTTASKPRSLGDPLSAGAGAVYDLAFSPDGRTLAAADDDHTVALWDVGNPATPNPLNRLALQNGPIRAVIFSPNGQVLAAASDDGTVQLWSLADPTNALPIGPALGGFGTVAHAVAFSPDGTRLAAGADDGQVRLWDVTDPNFPTPIGPSLAAQNQAIRALVFAPDGQTLITGGGEGTAKRWSLTNPAQPRPVGRPLAGSRGAVVGVAIGADGRTVITGSEDGVARLWSLPAESHPSQADGAIHRICDTTSAVLTPQAWAATVPQLPYRPPCPVR